MPPSQEKPKLVYWKLHGRSDFCQAMLYAGDIEYDVDADTANTWPSFKADTPFGQMPILKHGDLTLAQGGALTRYCARLAGLYPEDIVEASVCDMYLEEMMDIFGALFKVSDWMNENEMELWLLPSLKLFHIITYKRWHHWLSHIHTFIFSYHPIIHNHTIRQKMLLTKKPN